MSTDTGTMEPSGEYQNSQNVQHLMSDDSVIQDNVIVPNKEMPLIPPNPQHGAPEVNILHVHPTDEPIITEEEESPNGNCVQHSNMHLSGPLKDFAKQKLEDEQDKILQTNAKRRRLIGKLKKTLKNHSRNCFRGTLGIKPALNAIRLSLDKLTSSVNELSVNLEKHNTGLVEVAKSNASVLLVLSMIANREKEILEGMLKVHASRPSSVNTAEQLSPVDLVASTVPPIVKDNHTTHRSLTAPPMVKETHSPHSSLAAPPRVKATHSPHSSVASFPMVDVKLPRSCLTVPATVENGHPPHTSPPNVKDVQLPHSSLFVPAIIEAVPPPQKSLCSSPMVINEQPPHTSRTALSMVEISDGRASISRRRPGAPKNRQGVQLKRRKI